VFNGANPLLAAREILGHSSISQNSKMTFVNSKKMINNVLAAPSGGGA
jgi:hypothetical protein